MNTSGNIHHFRKTKWCFKHQRPHILNRTNSSQKKFNRNHVCVAIYSSLCASNWSLNIWNSRLTLNQIVLSWSSSWLEFAYHIILKLTYLLINRHLFSSFISMSNFDVHHSTLHLRGHLKGANKFGNGWYQ